RDDRPSRKAARNFLHVFLRVATVYTERVQLHQFARVVFIDAATLLLLLRSLLLRVVNHRDGTFAQQLLQTIRAWSLPRRLSIRTHTLKIIEIKKHRRTLRISQQQIVELAQRV